MPPAPFQRTPNPGIRVQWLDSTLGDIYESAVIRDESVPKEPGQQSKRMVRESWIHERLLALEGLNRAAARLLLIIHGGIDQLWKDLRHSLKPCRGTPIHPIPRLTEHKLSAGRVVSKIEPIENSASLSGRA